MAPRPLILLCPDTDDAALDRCLAALEVGTPAGTPLWIADNAQAGPRSLALIERWLQSTRLQADYTRRTRAITSAAHLQAALDACDDRDVVVLAGDVAPLPGWLEQLQSCLRRDASVATVTPWCNMGEAAAWPRCGELNPPADDLPRLARAAAGLPATHPELPAAVEHAVLLRGTARHKAGSVDGESFTSWQAALIDYSLRLAGFGWRNVLCVNSFVLRDHEAVPGDGDNDVLAARWPAWQPRLAGFLMRDPLHDLRASLQARYDADDAHIQSVLFDDIILP